MSNSKLPILKSRELIRALEKMGFRLTRASSGSHRLFEHADGRVTTIPDHKGRDLGPGLLRKILRDVELTPEELREWL